MTAKSVLMRPGARDLTCPPLLRHCQDASKDAVCRTYIKWRVNSFAHHSSGLNGLMHRTTICEFYSLVFS